MDVVDQAKQKMDSWHIGQTSAHRESGGRGPGTVSTGVGDHGGISYGTYQFSTNTGGASEYVAASAYRGRFAGLQPGTQEFGAKWQEVAAADPAGFAKDQHDFIQTLYYDKQMQRLQDVGIDLSGRGAAVQDALWSTSVQYRDLTRSVFQTGLKEAYGENYNLAQLTDEQIIRVAQDYKVGHIETNFKSSPDWWPGLRDRAVSEKGDLVALARYDAVNRNPEPYRGKDYQQAFGEQEPQQSRGRARANPMADGMLVSGERGAEVEALQNKLIQAGYSGKDGQPLSPDKHYGSNTEYAVREFQKANGLTEDGKAGKDTLDALDNAVRQQGNAMPGLVVPAEHVALAPTAPVQQKEQVAPARDLVRGERIQVIEPMGSADNKTNRTIPHGTSGNEAFRDLQIHHPKANHEAVRTGNAALADRHSEMIGGELETVRNTGDRNGTPLVHKDLILTDQEGLRAVMIPNPVAGYVEVNENKWNSISIWSHPAGHPNRELLGQVLHGERGSSPYKTGDYVEYGAPLIKQSDAGSPGAVHAHIELGAGPVPQVPGRHAQRPSDPGPECTHSDSTFAEPHGRQHAHQDRARRRGQGDAGKTGRSWLSGQGRKAALHHWLFRRGYLRRCSGIPTCQWDERRRQSRQQDACCIGRGGRAEAVAQGRAKHARRIEPGQRTLRAGGRQAADHGKAACASRHASGIHRRRAD